MLCFQFSLSTMSGSQTTSLIRKVLPIPTGSLHAAIIADFGLHVYPQSLRPPLAADDNPLPYPTRTIRFERRASYRQPGGQSLPYVPGGNGKSA